MNEAVDGEPYEVLSNDLLLVDVRSPCEYSRGHIPGAQNLPLFSDRERELVGKRYREAGRDPAFLLGLEFVGPKLADFVRTARSWSRESRSLRLYCMRGGLRSQSMSWLLSSAGLCVSLMDGGYKAYRRKAVSNFEEPQKIQILSGCSGSGKTEILKRLATLGEQVIDLEGLAQHKGSAFGGFEQPPELTAEMFQNQLHAEWSRLDRSKTLWLEDESKVLGCAHIPDGLWLQMRSAPVVYLSVPKVARMEVLVAEYSGCDSGLLLEALGRIRKRLGGVHYKLCCEALSRKDYGEVVDRCLSYYDRAYLHGLRSREAGSVVKVEADSADFVVNAELLLRYIETGVAVG